ncbi:hypothetical protein [Parafilimonas sp.]|uniref:hypothetical protein n=1 Tax=Parafilimonas sp. TaxID=1969739 RepID=UPI0039E270E1
MKKIFLKIWKYDINNFIFAAAKENSSFIMQRKSLYIDLTNKFSPIMGYTVCGAYNAE